MTVTKNTCRPSRLVRLATIVLAGSAACGVDDEETGVSQQLQSVQAGALVVGVPAASRPVTTTDGQRHLLYELTLQNTAATAIHLIRLDAWDVDEPNAVTSYDSAALAARFEPADPQQAVSIIPAGAIAAVFLDVTEARRGCVPRAFAHRLTVEQDGKTRVISGPKVPVKDEDAVHLAAPLRGGPLADLNGCCDGAHRRALLLFDGQFFLAQRYAIDFIRVDLAAADSGEDAILRGDPSDNASYFTYGNPILAVAPGRIVAMRDTVAENVPTEPLPPADIDSAAGNYVIERFEDGRFALYAHIQTKGVKVKVGDRVARGQVLGLVGNTGNSTAPHLHFHVMDRPSPLLSNGLPYVFDSFDLLATVDLTADDAPIQPVPPPTSRRRLLPRGGDILLFPN